MVDLNPEIGASLTFRLLSSRLSPVSRSLSLTDYAQCSNFQSAMHTFTGIHNDHLFIYI